MPHDRERYKVQPCVPECSPDPPEDPVCALFEKCRGCPYPAHGFICWRSDGSCILSEVERLNKSQEEKT